MTATPVRYSPAVEKPIENEEQVHRDLMDTMRSVIETTSKDYGHAVRSVHAKAHGILAGDLTIAAGLPAELAQGLFATPGAHEVVMRFSTNPGDILDDSVSAPRGLALKVLDVTGERLPDSSGETTQNFILVNAPAFAAPDAKAFLGGLKQLAATTDKAEWAKKLLSATLSGVEGVIEAVGGKSAMIATMGGTPITHPLGDSYYSQVPFRHGDFIAKLALVPVSPNLTELTGDQVNTSDRPDALREVIRDTIIEQGGTWELRVQLNTDLDAMPIEDTSVAWDEGEPVPHRRAHHRRAAALAWHRSRQRSRRADLFQPVAWSGRASAARLGQPGASSGVRDVGQLPGEVQRMPDARLPRDWRRRVNATTRGRAAARADGAMPVASRGTGIGGHR